jgi:soluble lytic murein transglycosylase-like protein
MASMHLSCKFFTGAQFIKFALPFLVLLGMSSQAAHADIYAFTDVNGTPNFTNVPTDERYELTARSEETKTEPTEITEFVLNKNLVRKGSQQKMLAPEINRAALMYHLDPALLHAVIATESGYTTNAVSRKGALGLMQLMPDTARRYGVTDPFNPAQNIQAGTQHLNSLLKRFDNNLFLALAAYNSGESNVVKYGTRIPPFPETQAYVPKVMRLYRKYQYRVW